MNNFEHRQSKEIRVSWYNLGKAERSVDFRRIRRIYKKEIRKALNDDDYEVLK